MTKRTKSSLPAPTGRELLWGFGYLLLQMFLLPWLLGVANVMLGSKLNTAELNFLFFLVNFIAILLIFRNLLGQGLRQATQHPAIFCQSVILGLVAYYACNFVVTWLILALVPDFANRNDAAIAGMLEGNWFLMAVGTVVLVPPVEECLYRGLIFRSLWNKSPWAAYLVSIPAFAMIHILGYIGVYSPLEIVMAFLQYLPAGLCLAWTYTKAQTIFAPIAVHALINAISINLLR